MTIQYEHQVPANPIFLLPLPVLLHQTLVGYFFGYRTHSAKSHVAIYKTATLSVWYYLLRQTV